MTSDPLALFNQPLAASVVGALFPTFHVDTYTSNDRFSPPLGARKLFVACKNFDRALVPTSSSPSLSLPSTVALAVDARFGSVVVAIVSSAVVVVVIIVDMMDDSIRSRAGVNELHAPDARSRRAFDVINTHTHTSTVLCVMYGRVSVRTTDRPTDRPTLLFRVLW